MPTKTENSQILHRNLRQDYPVAVSADRCMILDRNGQDYFDGSCGAAISCLGHNHPRVNAAIRNQLEAFEFAHTSFFTNPPAEKLATFLVDRAPEGLSHCYFVCGGSEAIETSLKLARQYQFERGEPQRTQFVARRQSYHGNTLGALSVGGQVQRRIVYEPILPPAHLVSPCYPYRDQIKGESEYNYLNRLMLEIEDTFKKIGPTNIIAFIAETVAGSSLGCVPPITDYFKRLRKLCHQYGIVLILDEVMSGMGRTGKLFAIEDENISPDIIACAKGLGGGYQPIGAVLCARRIVDTIKQRSGTFQHGHSYLAHPVACAAALAVQEVIEQDCLLENVMRRGAALEERLRDLMHTHEHIGDVRGRGLFWAAEFVLDKQSKEPFPAAQKLHHKVKQAGMKEGLLCYPMGGTADGVSGDHVMLAPPFIMDDEEFELLWQRFVNTLDHVFTN